MPGQTPVTMSKLLSGEIPPLVPTTFDPELRKYLTALDNYIRRLMGKFTPGNATSLLPPIPDPTLDYMLVYDATDGLVKWIETTEECLTP